ncbi:MAG: hypothetical protein MAG451_02120 [Anaerolineales bacterium]|nr:hypothetical protein [Anaerolineales bacterium]
MTHKPTLDLALTRSAGDAFVARNALIVGVVHVGSDLWRMT